MKPFLIAVLFLAALGMQAQSVEKIVFTHKTSGKTHVIAVGNMVKVWYTNDDNRTAYAKGKLLNVKENVMYLTKDDAVPLASVEKIKYYDPAKRWPAVVLLVLGVLFLLSGFFALGINSAFGGSTAGITAMFALGGVLTAGGIVYKEILTHKISDVGTEWNVDVGFFDKVTPSDVYVMLQTL